MRYHVELLNGEALEVSAEVFQDANTPHGRFYRFWNDPNADVDVDTPDREFAQDDVSHLNSV